MQLGHVGALLLLVGAVQACGGRSDLIVGGPCDPGGEGAFECVAPAPGSDACGPPVLVPAVCDAAAHAFRCPSGARSYARAPATSRSCLPFSDPAGPVAWVGSSLERVPTDDGRCLWIAEDVELRDGTRLRNVAFEPDLTAPFGACPTKASFLGGSPASVVQMAGGDDPKFLVQIASSFRWAGATHVVYRLFELDATAVFGVTLRGGGLGRWDASLQRITVPAPDTLPFPIGLSLGDAALVTSDFAYVWGCPKPGPLLLDDCIVTRFDAQMAMTLFAGAGSWITSQDGTLGATIFTSGPWASSVLPNPATGSGLLHVYIPGFGGSIEAHVGGAPEGPWTASSTLALCELPGDDAKAFCAGPVEHAELRDPRRPGELVLTYGVGTTATNQDDLMNAHPERYWTRLVRVAAP